MLKNRTNILSNILTYVISHDLNSHSVPEEWGHSVPEELEMKHISTINKKGNKGDCNN